MDLKNVGKKLKCYKQQLKIGVAMSYYEYCRINMQLDNKGILVQSRYGDDLGGNIFYLLKELASNYKEYKIYLAYNPEKLAFYKSLLKTYGINNINLVELHKIKYWRLLATCKYLLNDVTFHTCFIKREGQVYLNTWHGTPLKKMGLEEEQSNYLFGNMQRNFLASDYLLMPNAYMNELMIRAYSLNNLFRGTFVNEGYPRNAVFFDSARAEELKTDLGINDKQIIVYMPTWRGNSTTNKSSDYVNLLKKYLDELDGMLSTKQIFYVKLHPMAQNGIDLTGYKHICGFPAGYETYDFLNIADCLVTDYSSVMFDFACSRKNIVLFTYDIDEYLQDRGLYIDIKELPFTKATTVQELVECINAGKQYQEDDFINGIIEYENPHAVANVCELFINNINKCGKSWKLVDNGKKNVYIYIDSMLKNGITSSALNLLNCIDLDKRNYFVVFRKDGAKDNRQTLKNLPKNVGVLSLDTVERTLTELVANYLFYKRNVTNTAIVNILEGGYKRIFGKYYGHIKNGMFLQFVGYGRDPIHIFAYGAKTAIWVHNDMKREIEIKKVQHGPTLINAYKKYDFVAGVSVASSEIAKDVACGQGNHIVIHNCFDAVGTKQKADLPIEFQEDTEISGVSKKQFHELLSRPGINLLSSGNISLENQLNDFLDRPGMNFITIGRFSMEKQHDVLIDAFTRYWRDHQDAKLVIVGGYGNLYKKTLEMARSVESAKNICVIKSISNPISVLKKCSLFILSSSQEGLPVVFFEADCVGVPILSTDIDGPHEFLKEYGAGLLVEESADALYQGMLEFDKGNIKTLCIDMNKYNSRCVEEFEKLFEDV